MNPTTYSHYTMACSLCLVENSLYTSNYYEVYGYLTLYDYALSMEDTSAHQ